MLVSIAFFSLNKKIYEKGENLISKEFNINQSELDALAALYYMGEDDFTLSPTKLYDVLLFSSGGMTKLLKKLESRNFIKRVNNTIDKRSKLVQITDLGIKVMTNALKGIVSLENEYFSKLNAKEQDTFKKLIYKMLK